MKQILFIFVFLFLLIVFTTLLLSPFSMGLLTNEKELENMGISEHMEVASETDKAKADKFGIMNSLLHRFYDSQEETMNSPLNRFHDSPEAVCQNNQKYETLQKTVDNYVQRYISLFLITSNLLNREIHDLNEMILIDLEISITGQDLAYLQNYSKNLKDLSYLKNLSKLDAIFSKIARLKERSYKEKAMQSIMSLLTSSIYSLLSSYQFYRYFSLLSILISIWIGRYYLFSRSFYIFLAVLINSIIIWEGLNLQLKKIKEMELKLHVQSLQFRGIPEECYPDKIKWYQSIVNFFQNDKCLQYFETLNKSSIEEVSLFKCIIDMYAFYFIKTPVKIFGVTIRDLTDELLASSPWPVKYVLNIPIILLLALAGGIFILIFYGKQCKLSFFGASVEIVDIKTVPEKQMINNLNNERPKEFRIIRKLKPWTKSRFPKRLESDYVRRRKSFLKLPKSMVEKPESSQALTINGSTEAFSQQVNRAIT